MTLLDALRGSKLQRVDAPRPDLIALTLHRRDLHGVLLLCTLPSSPGWGWVDRRPRGEPASAFVGLLRKHLENARLREIEVRPGWGVLGFERGPTQAQLTLHGALSDGRPPDVCLQVDGNAAGCRRGGSLQGRGQPKGEPRGHWPDALEGLRAAGPTLVEAVFGAELEEQRRTLVKAVRRRIRQLRRRLSAIEGDLARVDQVAELRRTGSLLLAGLSQIPEDAEVAEVTDWEAEPPAPIRIAIGAGRSPRQEAEHRFRRARKLERGGEIALERHALTESAIAELERLLPDIERADEVRLAEAEREAARLRAAPAAAPTARGAKGSEQGRRPHRTFRSASGRSILVGRSAADNDALTLRHARPWDLWLHARGVTGSHVLVPLDKGEACPAELLIDAAHLAAHFSDQRGEDRVEVQHVERRYVRKPRSAPPGAVTLQREKVLLLRLEPERLQRLLKSG